MGEMREAGIFTRLRRYFWDSDSPVGRFSISATAKARPVFRSPAMRSTEFERSQNRTTSAVYCMATTEMAFSSHSFALAWIAMPSQTGHACCYLSDLLIAACLSTPLSRKYLSSISSAYVLTGCRKEPRNEKAAQSALRMRR